MGDLIELTVIRMIFYDSSLLLHYEHGNYILQGIDIFLFTILALFAVDEETNKLN